MQLYITSVAGAKGQDPILVDDLTKTFKEWGLKEDGASFQLREPGKKNAALQ
jgi:hypothetical protein